MNKNVDRVSFKLDNQSIIVLTYSPPEGAKVVWSMTGSKPLGFLMWKTFNQSL